jgi:hypothetical protein
VLVIRKHQPNSKLSAIPVNVRLDDEIFWGTKIVKLSSLLSHSQSIFKLITEASVIDWFVLHCQQNRQKRLSLAYGYKSLLWENALAYFSREKSFFKHFGQVSSTVIVVNVVAKFVSSLQFSGCICGCKNAHKMPIKCP